MPLSFLTHVKKDINQKGLSVNNNHIYSQEILIDIGQSLKNNNSIEITKILPPKDKFKTAATTGTKSATAATTISPIDPVSFKFLYAKENQKLEIHMELGWTPK